MESKFCPVCGFEFPPGSPQAYAGKQPSFGICPCCGFEFGITDWIGQETFESWRARWIVSGPQPFDSLGSPMPAGWDPDRQLRNIGLTLSGERTRVYEETVRARDLTALEDPSKFRDLVLQQFAWLLERDFALIVESRFRLGFRRGSGLVFVTKDPQTGWVQVRLVCGNRPIGLKNLLKALGKASLSYDRGNAVPRNEGDLRQYLSMLSDDLVSVCETAFNGPSEWLDKAVAIEKETGG